MIRRPTRLDRARMLLIHQPDGYFERENGAYFFHTFEMFDKTWRRRPKWETAPFSRAIMLHLLAQGDAAIYENDEEGEPLILVRPSRLRRMTDLMSADAERRDRLAGLC